MPQRNSIPLRGKRNKEWDRAQCRLKPIDKADDNDKPKYQNPLVKKSLFGQRERTEARETVAEGNTFSVNATCRAILATCQNIANVAAKFSME
jgi:hypothetical protein